MLSEFGSITQIFAPFSLLLMFCGVFGGLLIGALPGLTGTMAVALLVPVTFGMPVEHGLILLVAVYIGSISGGLVSAALLNIPGTPSSVATTFDAYPMVARGEAGKALGIGVFASFMGCVISFICLVALAPVLGSFALRFGPCEYFSLVIFTLTCISAVSKKSLLKGFLAAALGLLMSTVGLSEVDAVPRFTFDTELLQSGFGVMPVLIGMYAISQVMEEVKTIRSAVKVPRADFTIRQFWSVALLCLRSWKNLVRSSLIGTAIGILPGVGPGLSNIVAYSQARAADKHPETFGQGNPDGIIASESANNASCGGAMIPLLTLGIPGDSTTMMMLGAFMIHGVQPGPLLLRDNPDLVLLILAAFLVSSFFMLIVQMRFIKLLIKALSISRPVLFPIILALCTIGSFALNSSMSDVWVFFLMGLVGIVLNKLDFPLLPLVLGLILGKMAEQELRTSLIMGHGTLSEFLHRPIALAFIGLSVLSVLWSIYRSRAKAA